MINDENAGRFERKEKEENSFTWKKWKQHQKFVPINQWKRK